MLDITSFFIENEIIIRRRFHFEFLFTPTDDQTALSLQIEECLYTKSFSQFHSHTEGTRHIKEGRIEYNLPPQNDVRDRMVFLKTQIGRP